MNELAVLKNIPVNTATVPSTASILRGYGLLPVNPR